MSKKEGPFGNVDAETQKEWQREARLQYDPALVRESQERWGSYSNAQRDFVLEEGNAIYAAFADALRAGHSATSAEVQEIAARWHEHLRRFYEPSLDLLAGLGELYNTDARFIANFQKLHADLPAFLQASIVQYVDDLETAALEAMLAEDDEDDARAQRLSK